MRQTSGIVLLVLCLITGWCLAGELREWTDSTGKYKTKAEFVSLKNGKVTLRKENGEEKTLPLAKLSPADQKIAQDLAKQSEKQGSPNKRRRNSFVNNVRSAPLRVESMNKMKQIALALINFESATGRFPTAAFGQGKQGLSWRVAILPYLEHQNLYQQFRLNEPWDSPHNKKLIERMPSVFASPGSSVERGWTNYLAIVGDDSIIVKGKKGTRIRDIRDGTSKTLILVEANDDEAAIWTKPDDYEWDPNDPAAGLGGIWPGQFLGAFADGQVRRINLGIGKETLNAMFTRNGMESYSLD